MGARRPPATVVVGAAAPGMVYDTRIVYTAVAGLTYCGVVRVVKPSDAQLTRAGKEFDAMDTQILDPRMYVLIGRIV